MTINHDILINDLSYAEIFLNTKKSCIRILCGNNVINQILLLRILSNKIQDVCLKLKNQENKLNDLDNLINNSKPTIFWKEKPLVKKQLSIWSLR